jgi:methylthioribose-1-phosphate isomerase
MNDTKQRELSPLRLSEDGRILHLLDQRALPGETRWLELGDLESVARAIEDLAVRGAPAIGCAAAMGCAVASQAFDDEPTLFRTQLAAARERLARTRPTAVNLFVALEEVADYANSPANQELDASSLRAGLARLAREHAARDLAACKAMGAHGAEVMPESGGILTHCNTGALATAGWGTALGVIRSTHALGRRIHVFVDETRPVLQGARLTAWELDHDGIDFSLITDSMAASIMRSGEVQAVIVGADRIARNGDVANKIGTYAVAILARYHDIPFYVAAPWTTVDLSLESGEDIPIEERSADEVRLHGGQLMAPARAAVRNPAFDVTPAGLIAGIVTETGVYAPTELAEAGSGRAGVR